MFNHSIVYNSVKFWKQAKGLTMVNGEINYGAPIMEYYADLKRANVDILIGMESFSTTPMFCWENRKSEHSMQIWWVWYVHRLFRGRKSPNTEQCFLVGESRWFLEEPRYLSLDFCIIRNFLIIRYDFSQYTKGTKKESCEDLKAHCC